MRLTQLKLERLKAGLLQIELAGRTRIPVARLSQYENAHRVPTDVELARLAAVLGVPTTALAGLEAAPPPTGAAV
jgi:transcriptional regulator with XRE-family HTH domain